jgi:HlyD family secretion protein
MKRLTPILIVLLCVGGALGTLYFLWSKSKTRPQPAHVESLELRDIVKKTVATGAIVPREEVEIKPRVSGVIEELFVEAGAPIKQGEKLARIRIVPDAASLQRASSSVQAARISVDTAKRELTRAEGLFAQGVISEAELSNAKTALAMAQQTLASANEGLQIVKEGQSSSTGKVNNVVVTSTVDGMVIDVPVKVGFSVIETNPQNAGTTIAVVADMSDMIFQGQVDESEVGKIKVGLPLDIKIGALEKEVFEGTLEHIAPKGKEIDGAIQFEIKASVKPKKDVFVRAGYSANADVVLDKRTQVLAIREALLQWKEGKPFVEVETSKGMYAKRDVKLGLSDGIYAEILDGVGKDAKIKQPTNAGPPQMGQRERQGPPRGAQGGRR